MIGNELIELAMELTGTGDDDRAVKLNEIALRVQQLENIAGGLGLEDQAAVPTAVQGLALARFLRNGFRDEADRGTRYASISRGGAGLSDDYLHVRLADGYEGGIDREGRVST